MLIDCGRTGGLARTGEIGKRLGISQQNAFKIAALLSKAGFVSTVRGCHGGLRLARPADEIKVGDVVRAFERKLQGVAAGMASVRLTETLNEAREAFFEAFDQDTIADLANQRGRTLGKRNDDAKASETGSRTRR
jgi:Rrf2 family protein